MMATRKKRKAKKPPQKKRRTRSKKQKRGDGLLYFGGFILLAVGYAMVMTAGLGHEPVLTSLDVLPLGFIASLFALFWLIFRGEGYRGDRIIPLLTCLLAGLGVLVQFRLGMIKWPEWTQVATYVFPLGIAVYVIVWAAFRRGRYAMLARFAFPCWLLAIVVLVGMLAFGQRFRGGVFLPGNLNPAEVIKPLLAIFMAGMLTQYRKPLQQTVAGLPAPPWQTWMGLGLLWSVPMALLMVHRDLGMMIILNITLLLLIFMATSRWGYLVGGLIVIALASYAGFQFFSHAQIRYAVWQDPFQDAMGRGWQVLQSLSAMFSGGLLGSGLGTGAPGMVPIASSDFVYAVWAEELGFVGSLWLVSLYLLLYYRGYRIADQIRAPFAQTLAAALVTLLAVQTLMNLGGVTKAIPLTGITLPLISHGGSSLLVTCAMLGLLTALSEPK